MTPDDRSTAEQENAPELPFGRLLKSKSLGGNRVILVDNGMTAMQDVATGSRDQTTVRNHELYSTYLALVGETP